MPRIPDEVLDCTVILYPSEAAAKAGERTGGSGFLVAVRSETHPEWFHQFVVTASHTVREGNSPVVRLNNLSGDFDVLPFEQSNWLHHPDGDDVAIVPLVLPHDQFRRKAIDTSLFLTQKIIEDCKIVPGDDVFMVGRFINHGGRQRNSPTARFGTIGQMAEEPIYHDTRGINQESYLIEMHSIPG